MGAIGTDQHAARTSGSYLRRFEARLPKVLFVWLGLSLLGFIGRIASGGATIGYLAGGALGAMILAVPTTALVALWPRRTRPVTAVPEPVRASDGFHLPVPRGHPRRRKPWLLWAGLVVAAAVALVLADTASQRSEMNKLLNAVQASESAMKKYQSDMGRVAEEWKATPGQPVSLLRNQVAASCGTGAADIRVAGEAVSRVDIAFWHPAIQRAKDSYLDHSKAWQEKLLACAADPAELGNKAKEANIASSWTITRQAMKDSVAPWFFAGEIRDRETGIFGT